jgi:hypothetical protein
MQYEYICKIFIQNLNITTYECRRGVTPRSKTKNSAKVKNFNLFQRRILTLHI